VNSRRQKLALCLGSVVFCLLVGEVAARVLLPHPFVSKMEPNDGKTPRNGEALRSLHRADPKLGWVLNPGPLEYEHRFVDEHGSVQYDAVYSIENGQRRTSLTPHPGPVIVAAGCSFTFGHAVRDEDTWPWLLQDQLPDYRVLNTGDMGYGTDQALLAAEKQVLSAPGKTDAVVLGLGDFQIDRNRGAQGWLVFVSPFAKPLFKMTADGAEYDRQVHFWSPGFVGDHSALFAHLTNTLANRVYGITSHAGARQLTAALITTFARKFQSMGVGFAVVVLPYADDQGPQSKADRAFLIDRLSAAHIPVFIPDFPRLPDGHFDVEKFMVNKKERHPNRQYNLILANQLKPFLQSAGIITK